MVLPVSLKFSYCNLQCVRELSIFGYISEHLHKFAIFAFYVKTLQYEMFKSTLQTASHSMRLSNLCSTYIIPVQNKTSTNSEGLNNMLQCAFKSSVSEIKVQVTSQAY